MTDYVSDPIPDEQKFPDEAAYADGDIYVAEVSHSDYGSGWHVPSELRSMQKLVRER